MYIIIIILPYCQENTQQGECSHTLNAGSVGLAWASLPSLCPSCAGALTYNPTSTFSYDVKWCTASKAHLVIRHLFPSSVMCICL